MEADRLGGCKRVALIVDTNMLIYMAQGLFSPSMILEAVGYPYTMILTPPILRELRDLSLKGRPKERITAAKALEIIEKQGYVEAGDEALKADDSIEAIALRLKASGCRVVVATTDRELRRRLRARGIPSLYYRRARASLELEWEPI